MANKKKKDHNKVIDIDQARKKNDPAAAKRAQDILALIRQRQTQTEKTPQLLRAYGSQSSQAKSIAIWDTKSLRLLEDEKSYPLYPIHEDETFDEWQSRMKRWGRLIDPINLFWTGVRMGSDCDESAQFLEEAFRQAMDLPKTKKEDK